jgi:hypothetical protein
MDTATEVTAVHPESNSCFAWRAGDVVLRSHPGIRTGQTAAPDPVKAVRELQRLLFQPYAELVIFFCSSEYDLDAVAREMNDCFVGVQVVGCASAGGIGPLGYVRQSLCGISFASNVLAAVSGRVDNVRNLDPDGAEALVGLLRGRLDIIEPDAFEKDMFAFQMVDGLSMCEESITRAFQNALGSIPLVGGSAGDPERCPQSLVFEQGRFRQNSAVLVVAASSLPFTTFCMHHLAGTDRRAVVTGVGPCGRTVTEIDGLPAVEGYARLFGAQTTELEPRFFATRPVVVRIGGADYARGVGRANADGSLTFHCAMEEGIVLRCAVENDVMTDVMGSFTRLNRQIGRPSAVLMCDSVQRMAEIAQLGLGQRISSILYRQNAVGFSSHGGQSQGIHMNQALLGIAFGQGDAQ